MSQSDKITVDVNIYEWREGWKSNVRVHWIDAKLSSKLKWLRQHTIIAAVINWILFCQRHAVYQKFTEWFHPLKPSECFSSIPLSVSTSFNHVWKKWMKSERGEISPKSPSESSSFYGDSLGGASHNPWRLPWSVWVYNWLPGSDVSPAYR